MLQVPGVDDPVMLADWLELHILTSAKKRLSRTTIRRLLRPIFPDAGLGSEDLDENSLDVSIDAVLVEMARRRQLAAAGYPFREFATGVEFVADPDGLTYVFLLLVSVSPRMRAERRHREVDLAFDSVVLEALKVYLGPKSSAVRFGWPPSDGRPARFSAALQWLAHHMGLDLGKGPARKVSKDGGLDVVAWLPWRDHRSGYAVVLAQCTIQTEWIPKATDIVADVWRGWIDVGKEPLTCLAIPFVVGPDFEQWDQVRRTVHIVFERLRIADMLPHPPRNIERLLWDWVAREISILSGTTRLIDRWEPDAVA